MVPEGHLTAAASQEQRQLGYKGTAQTSGGDE